MHPRWFWNDGGPLLVLPRAPAAVWEGADPPRGGRVVEATFRAGASKDPATDYDRACDVAAAFGLLAVEGAWGVVLGTELAQSAVWLPAAESTSACYLVGAAAIDDDRPERLQALLADVGSGEWTVLGRDLPVGAEGLLLLHAASRPEEVAVLAAFAETPPERGAVIGEALQRPMPAGRYDVAVVELQSESGEYLGAVRFTLRAPAP